MYEVRWRRSALDDLARLWLAADSALRNDLNAASDDVDRLLSSDPTNHGESRERGHRIAFVPPLALIFRVNSAQQIARVLSVRLLRRRSP